MSLDHVADANETLSTMLHLLHHTTTTNYILCKVTKMQANSYLLQQLSAPPRPAKDSYGEVQLARVFVPLPWCSFFRFFFARQKFRIARTFL